MNVCIVVSVRWKKMCKTHKSHIPQFLAQCNECDNWTYCIENECMYCCVCEVEEDV